MDGEPSKSKVPIEKSGGFRCSTKYTSAYSWRNRQPTFSPFRFYPSVTSYWTISIEPIETQIAKFDGARVFPIHYTCLSENGGFLYLQLMVIVMGKMMS